MPSCGQCGSGRVSRLEEVEDFQYGVGDDSVRLSATVPVYTCGDCEFRFTNELAEVLRHDAVCKHIGVLTPGEITAIRGEFNLTRERFSHLTGFGIASLARWENGQLIQSKSNNLIYK
jgi:DNA-binding transcriptional regulator YiaG